MLCWSRVLLLLYVLLLAAATEDSGGAAMSHAEEGPPLNVIVEAVSGTALNMSWDPPDEEPQYYEVTDVRDSFNELAYTTYCLIDELQPCTTYFYTVTSDYGSIQYSSPPTSGTTLASVPPPPLNCHFGHITTNSMYLTWSAPDTACHIRNYNISWSWSSLWEDEHDSGETLSTVTHTSLSDLPPYANVTVNIAAATDAGFGPPLTCWSVTQHDRGAPQDVTVTAVSESALRVSWDPPSEDPDYYSIAVGTAPGVPVYTTSYILEGLEPCTEYEISVASEYGNDEYMATPVMGKTLDSVPPPPLNCDFDRITTNSMYLTWSAPDTGCYIRNYNISWSWSSLWEDEHGSGETLSTGTHTSVWDLPAYAIVTVNIAAATDLGFGPPLTCWNVTQQDKPGPPVINIIEINGNVGIVFWTPPEEVNGVIIYYEILFEGERGESISKSVDGTHLSGTVSDLQNGNYDVTVRAETAAGWGEESVAWSIVV
ncbi:collagen alpha-1(XII) chain-like isoform X1 [Homarus americanus]|uniref:collagen alpha-1(XII) chain-like isoform X1 n=1 Tax=Homarus americanus TaxID=6706 RepID=UPI001C4629BE|nr:collagen alpha-1(XII) chain-like isoform X1 [Homarus americanus]